MTDYYPADRIWPRGHQNAKVAALTAVLDAAYHEMIGMGQTWDADPEYSFDLRPQWATPEGREALVSYLDSEWLDEMTKNAHHWHPRGIIAHPCYFKLNGPQRLALCQRLHDVLQQYPEPFEAYNPPPSRMPVDLPPE